MGHALSVPSKAHVLLSILHSLLGLSPHRLGPLPLGLISSSLHA